MIRESLNQAVKLLMNNDKSIFDIKSLYRDVSKSLIDSALKQKDVVMEVLAKEVKNFLTRVDLAEELRKTLQGMSVKLSAHFDFDNDGKIKVSKDRPVRGKVKKRKGRKRS